MARYSFIQNTFSSGVWSPRAYGRSNLDGYKDACKTLKNVLPHKQGGASKRPGSYYLSTYDSHSSRDIRVFPYVLDTENAFLVTLNLNDATSGHRVQAYDVNHATTTYASAPSVVGFNNISDLKYDQFAQYLYIVHPLQQPFRISITNAGVITPEVFPAAPVAGGSKKWPYLDANTTSNGLLINNAAVGAGRSITADSALFNALHVGSVWKVEDSGTIGFFVITAYLSPTAVTVTVLDACPAAMTGTPITDWSEGAWSDYRGWPRSVVSHEGRLIFGGNNTLPNRLWGAKIGDQTFLDEADVSLGSPTNLDPFALDIQQRSYPIQWLSPGKQLFLSTYGNEVAGSATDTSVLGRLTFNFSSEADIGSNYIQGIRVNNAPIFAGRGGSKLFEFIFNFNEDSFRSEDISVLYEHFLRKETAVQVGIGADNMKMVFAKNYGDLVFVRPRIGSAFTIMRDRPLNLNSAQEFVLGGNNGSGVDPFIQDIAVVPTLLGDAVFMVVNRTINSVAVVTLERLENEFTGDYADFGASVGGYSPAGVGILFDCAHYEDYGSPTTDASGFTHLAGESVSVIADGNYLGQKTVSGSGHITLDTAATVVWAGYDYETIIETLPLVQGSNIGTALGQISRIDGLQVNFERTMHAQYGSSSDKLVDFLIRTTAHPMGSPVDLFTGFKKVNFSGDYDREVTAMVYSNKGLPMTVNYMVMRGLVNE